MYGYVSDAQQLYGLDLWYRMNQTKTYEAEIHIVLLFKPVVCKIREEGRDLHMCPENNIQFMYMTYIDKVHYKTF